MQNNLHFLKNKTILYAEDDKITREQMSEMLGVFFKNVLVACDGEEAFDIYKRCEPDIVATDIMMPKLDGINLAKLIREKNYTIPIVLITSFVEKDLLINAANLSVDGYLVKPVSTHALIETFCTAIQRSQKYKRLVHFDDATYYDMDIGELFKNGEQITLGAKERSLLLLLIANIDRTTTKNEIFETLWPLDETSDSTLKTLIYRIRKKIDIDIIKSIKGYGYKLITIDDDRTLA